MRTPASIPPTLRRLLAGTAASLVVLAGAAACSADDSSGASASDADSGASQEQTAPRTPPDLDGSAQTQGSDAFAVDPSAVAASVTDRKLARRAEVALEVTSITEAAARLRAVATAADGLVIAEEVSSGTGAEDTGAGVAEPGAGWGTVTISVPTDRLEATLDDLGTVGTVLSRSTSTDDVTAATVDTAARVTSATASVQRIRALMGKATTLTDIVALESELSERQAELESMQQLLASLEDKVALAPITVRLSTSGASPSDAEPTGFVAGLAAGWSALTTSLRLLLTMAGAVLPFAAAGAVLIAPVLWWWRRRPRAQAPAVTAPPAVPGT